MDHDGHTECVSRGLAHSTKNDWMILMVEAGAPAADTLNLSHLQTIGEQELTGQKLRGTSAGGTDDFGFNALGGRSHGAGQGTKDLHVKGTWFFDMQDPRSNVGGGEYFRIEMTTSTNHVQIARNRKVWDHPPVHGMQSRLHPGCMDSPTTPSTTPTANTDDGSCATPVVEGCWTPTTPSTTPPPTLTTAAAPTRGGRLYRSGLPGIRCCSQHRRRKLRHFDGLHGSGHIQYDANAVVDNGLCPPHRPELTFDGHTYDVVQIPFVLRKPPDHSLCQRLIPGELDNGWSGTTDRRPRHPQR